MLRHREEITIDELFGVDLSEAETAIGKGRFRALENIIPLGLRKLRRKPGTSLLINTYETQPVVDNLGNPVLDENGDVVVVVVGGSEFGLRTAKLHTFHRTGAASETLAAIHRDGDTDGLFKRVSGNWVLIGALAGTGAKYDMVTRNEKVYITDGQTDDVQTYDGTVIATLTDASVPTKCQYCTVHQERLILAGGPDNRSRMWFSEPLLDTFAADAFHDIRVGTGSEISGLGINSINTSELGAQNQLIVFKDPAPVVSIIGVLGSGQELLAVRGSQVGCPSHKTIVNSPFGLIFMGLDSVYILDQSNGEPIDIGAELGDEILNSGQPSEATGIIYNGFYHLSVAAPGQVTNTREWMLQLNPKLFPQQHNWYGPHLGDEISDYTIDNDQLVATREESTSLWRLMVPGNNFSMIMQTTPRVAKLVSPRISAVDLRVALFDSVGIMASASQSRVTVDVAGTIELLPGTAGAGVSTMIWDVSQWDNAVWAGTRLGPMVVRPRKRGTDVQITIEHLINEDFEIHSLWIRHKKKRRQQESL